MKILFVATVRSHIGQFHMPTIRALQEDGHEVHAAYKDNSTSKPGLDLSGIDKVFEVPFERSPLRLENVNAYRVLKRIICSEHYDIIHCHTPMGGVVTRLAARKNRRSGTKVFYTAHGFHFWKGAPLKNWMFFYPVEWLLAHWTDVLMTINEEDYALAHKHMHAKRVEFVPGIGIDLQKFAPHAMSEEEKHAKREQLGLKTGERMMLSVGELMPSKNHELVLRALAEHPDLRYKYCICGVGPLHEKYTRYIADNDLSERVSLLGYRRDIAEILQVTDLFVFPSTCEGLPVALMEAIASKVMIVCSDTRGNSDLVKDKQCLFDYRSVDELIQVIHNVESMSEEERNRILEDNYSRLRPREKSAIIARMKEIYREAGKG